MGLESAQYIPELVDTNPIGATDPVSEGDNHLRMIKLVLQTTFPAFIGTQGAPKSVSLTEDEINGLLGAAINATDETITGTWTFDELITAVNGVLMQEAGVTVAESTSIALGSLLIESLLTAGTARKAGFRNPETADINNGDASLQEHEGQVLNYVDAAGIFTVNALEVATTFTIIHTGSGDLSLNVGSATINWLDGLGIAQGGARTILPNSVVQLYWDSASTIQLWGNGIS